MISLLTIATMCGIIFFLARRLVQKRRGKKITVRTRNGVESWIASEVGSIVSRKLSLSRDELARSMGGEPDADLVSAVERAVSKVDVTYERLPGVSLAIGQIELRVDVTFEDGTSQRATRTVSSSELPDAVREELSRTGASQVHRAWAMPWSE